MAKDEKPKTIKKEIEKPKKEKEKEPKNNIATPEQPIKGRALIWVLLFGMVLSFIAAFISIILKSHGVI